MLIPLATLLIYIDEKLLAKDAFDKIDKWYWISIFSERYAGAVDTSIHQDYNDLIDWFSDSTKAPRALREAEGAFKELDSTIYNVKSRGSATFRGVICLLVTRGALDFHTGQPIELSKADIDHIFPKSKFGKHKFIDSILNKTLLSKETNELIKRAQKPSEYVKEFLKGHNNDEKKLMETLSSHLVDEEAYCAMINDDFESFINARKNAILNEIGRLMGFT
jgi:hypothetical protein